MMSTSIAYSTSLNSYKSTKNLNGTSKRQLSHNFHKRSSTLNQTQQSAAGRTISTAKAHRQILRRCHPRILLIVCRATNQKTWTCLHWCSSRKDRIFPTAVKKIAPTKKSGQASMISPMLCWTMIKSPPRRNRDSAIVIHQTQIAWTLE